VGEWKYSSTILDSGTRWKWVFRLTGQPLYFWGQNPRYPQGRMLGGSHSRSGRCGGEKNITIARNRTRAVQHVARRYTDWAIPAQVLIVNTDKLFYYFKPSSGIFYCRKKTSLTTAIYNTNAHTYHLRVHSCRTKENHKINWKTQNAMNN
jgi:hypothetical protein